MAHRLASLLNLAAAGNLHAADQQELQALISDYVIGDPSEHESFDSDTESVLAENDEEDECDDAEADTPLSKGIETNQSKWMLLLTTGECLQEPVYDLAKPTEQGADK
ncbi:hypothetical protein BaRGS_00002767 [Batillaria attramentaria]|uniref:Uncharacterized protein n=1 Tax=Batillaria attramentaria TaxID=370345 RepID=A0ABD0M2A2_9CAEN